MPRPDLFLLPVALGLMLAATTSKAQERDPLFTTEQLARMANLPAPQEASLERIDVGGRERSYWIVRPPGLTRPAPVVFVLHGGGPTDGRGTFRYGLHERGLRDGVITVHPNGAGGPGSGWNDGRGSSFLLARGDAPDDVAFFRAMIDRLIADGSADPDQVYVTGGSNGGMMTLRLACETSDRLAGVAAFVANLPEPLQTTCRPSRPIPVLLMNGTADVMMPYDGGPVAPITGQDRGMVLSTRETVDFWVQANGCIGDPERLDLPDVDPSDGTRVSLEAHRACADGTTVVLYSVDGGGHQLPRLAEAGPRQVQPRTAGVSSRDIDGAEVIWTFLLGDRPEAQ